MSRRDRSIPSGGDGEESSLGRGTLHGIAARSVRAHHDHAIIIGYQIAQSGPPREWRSFGDCPTFYWELFSGGAECTHRGWYSRPGHFASWLELFARQLGPWRWSSHESGFEYRGEPDLTRSVHRGSRLHHRRHGLSRRRTGTSLSSVTAPRTSSSVEASISIRPRSKAC